MYPAFQLARVICPSGGIRDVVFGLLSSPSRKNISVFPKCKSVVYLAPSRLDKRGVSRSSRTLGRDAVDAAALLTNGAKADGEVVWS